MAGLMTGPEVTVESIGSNGHGESYELFEPIGGVEMQPGLVVEMVRFKGFDVVLPKANTSDLLNDIARESRGVISCEQVDLQAKEWSPSAEEYTQIHRQAEPLSY